MDGSTPTERQLDKLVNWIADLSRASETADPPSAEVVLAALEASWETADASMAPLAVRLALVAPELDPSVREPYVRNNFEAMLGAVKKTDTRDAKQAEQWIHPFVRACTTIAASRNIETELKADLVFRLIDAEVIPSQTVAIVLNTFSRDEFAGNAEIGDQLVDALCSKGKTYGSRDLLAKAITEPYRDQQQDAAKIGRISNSIVVRGQTFEDQEKVDFCQRLVECPDDRSRIGAALLIGGARTPEIGLQRALDLLKSANLGAARYAATKLVDNAESWVEISRREEVQGKGPSRFIAELVTDGEIQPLAAQTLFDSVVESEFVPGADKSDLALAVFTSSPKKSELRNLAEAQLSEMAGRNAADAFDISRWGYETPIRNIGRGGFRLARIVFAARRTVGRLGDGLIQKQKR